MKHPKRTTRRRRPATYITLPGGAKITFRGFLPDKPCPKCTATWQAAGFIKRIYASTHRRWIVFGDWCLLCDPPDECSRDLNGVRPKGPYTNGVGQCVGWRERNRAGLFGPELPLEQMGLRKTADGVWRPQPKIDRRSVEKQEARPLAPKQYRAVTDHRRCFSETVIAEKAREQKHVCLACGMLLTAADPPVGGHRWPYALGWPTESWNCIAIHAACNSAMGRRSLEQYRHDERRNRRLFGAGTTETSGTTETFEL